MWDEGLALLTAIGGGTGIGGAILACVAIYKAVVTAKKAKDAEEKAGRAEAAIQKLEAAFNAHVAVQQNQTVMTLHKPKFYLQPPTEPAKAVTQPGATSAATEPTTTLVDWPPGELPPQNSETPHSDEPEKTQESESKN